MSILKAKWYDSQLMELFSRIIVSLTLLIFLSLGVKMALGKAGRGHVTALRDGNILRTFCAAALAILVVWFVIFPGSIPQQFLMVLPPWLEWAGLIIFVVGVSVRIISQKELSAQWSADISLKLEHHLITTGPYVWVRHPMYASYLLIAPGLLLVSKNWLIAIPALAYVLLSLARIPKEEALLHSKFGSEYEQYVQHTPGKIFPF